MPLTNVPPHLRRRPGPVLKSVLGGLTIALIASMHCLAADQSRPASAAQPVAGIKTGEPFVTSPLFNAKEGRLPAKPLSEQDQEVHGSTSFGSSPSVEASKPASGKSNAVTQENRAYGAYQLGYYLTAMQLALPEAEKGSAPAQTLLAEIFSQGLGVPRSMDDATFWYGQAAKNGDPSAELNYAMLLMQGKYVKKDVKAAKELMKKAADAGIPLAEFNHAQWLVNDEPGQAGITAALPYYEKAAQAGVPDAEYALSQIYHNAAGIPDDKRKQARYWLERAALADFDTAQLDLGIWLVDGVNGPTDYDNGFKWMKRAAEGGNVMAENRLAHLYRNGIGTTQDRIAAAAWYIVSRRAGLQDNDLADFFQGLTGDEQKDALKRANAIQQRQ